MLHIGSVPWKPGYVALLLVLPLYLPALSRGLLRQSTPFFVLFGVLIFATSVGTLVFSFQTDVLTRDETLRSLQIFALAPLAFVAGLGDRRRQHRYLVWTMLAFLLLNGLTQVYHGQGTWLTNLYGLEAQLNRPQYAGHATGIFENPNIGALSMTLLFLFVVVGVRRGFVRPSAAVVVTAFWTALMMATMMVSRNQMLAILLASVVLPFYLPRRVAIRSLGVGIVLIAITATVIWGSGDRLPSVLHVDMKRALTSGFGKAVQSTLAGDEDTDQADSLLTRPFLFFGQAVERWSHSPVVGTGFEPVDDFPTRGYHNDWLIILVSSGMVGLATLGVLVWLLFRLDPVLTVPFVLPGLTNAFITAPQHFILVMMVAGMVAARRYAR